MVGHPHLTVMVIMVIGNRGAMVVPDGGVGSIFGMIVARDRHGVGDRGEQHRRRDQHGRQQLHVPDRSPEADHVPGPSQGNLTPSWHLVECAP